LTSVFDASRITVNGENHSETGFLSFVSVSLDMIDKFPTISAFFAVNLITFVASLIQLLLSEITILNSYVHSSGTVNSYVFLSSIKACVFLLHSEASSKYIALDISFVDGDIDCIFS
jgi:hypothetical protein